MTAERGAHRGTVESLRMYDQEQHQQNEKAPNVLASQKEVSSEHENIPGKIYFGSKLKLLAPASQILSAYTVQTNRRPEMI